MSKIVLGYFKSRQKVIYLHKELVRTHTSLLRLYLLHKSYLDCQKKKMIGFFVFLKIRFDVTFMIFRNKIITFLI